ncbi:Protein similar [Pseudolycoriella hygida]|uniref:Protein similar n=1 Tax=Pseudolycoriella hygida TaxID=35572 RepID=A0A9Q0MU68_9DIPT|nr:Protein similar [Pseudolycoriella hygida]
MGYCRANLDAYAYCESECGIENENDIYTCAQLEARQKSKKPIELNRELNESDKDIIEKKQQKPSTNRNCVPAAAVNNLKAVTAKLLPTIKDNKPRSVTASVFSSVADIGPTKLPIQTRAQSVTASVFTPLATLNARSQSNTAKLFAPRTEDMNRSLLMFLDEGNDSTANMLKEEQDDLANLAPTAGDECIPLDVSTPLFGEMFDGFILPDGYGTLLPDDIGQFDSQNNKTNVDPFMNYRDDSNDTIGTPNVLSPRDSSKSPNSSSLPSLCSPNSLSHDDEFAFMTMNCEDDIDLTMRAPYIPMNENDDLPLLTEDLMWSAFSDELNLHKDIREALQNEQFKDSSLAAALLSANNITQLNQNGDEIDIKKCKTTESNGDGGNGMIPSDGILKQVYNKSSNQEQWSMNDLIQISPPPIIKSISNISPIQNNTNRVLKPPPRTYNKRPLHQSPLELNATKRVKPTFDQQQSAPQLLQQLMAPTSQQRVRLKEDATIKIEPTTKWTIDKNSQMQLIDQQQQTSNSVLKNLLVSGCDVSAGYICILPMRSKKPFKA